MQIVPQTKVQNKRIGQVDYKENCFFWFLIIWLIYLREKVHVITETF